MLNIMLLATVLMKVRENANGYKIELEHNQFQLNLVTSRQLRRVCTVLSTVMFPFLTYFILIYLHCVFCNLH